MDCKLKLNCSVSQGDSVEKMPRLHTTRTLDRDSLIKLEKVYLKSWKLWKIKVQCDLAICRWLHPKTAPFWWFACRCWIMVSLFFLSTVMDDWGLEVSYIVNNDLIFPSNLESDPLEIYVSSYDRLTKRVKLEPHVRKLIFALLFGLSNELRMRHILSFWNLMLSSTIYKKDTSSIKVVTMVKNSLEVALLSHGKSILGNLVFLLHFHPLLLRRFPFWYFLTLNSKGMYL